VAWWRLGRIMGSLRRVSVDGLEPLRRREIFSGTAVRTGSGIVRWPLRFRFLFFAAVWTQPLVALGPRGLLAVVHARIVGGVNRSGQEKSAIQIVFCNRSPRGRKEPFGPPARHPRRAHVPTDWLCTFNLAYSGLFSRFRPTTAPHRRAKN